MRGELISLQSQVNHQTDINSNLRQVVTAKDRRIRNLKQIVTASPSQQSKCLKYGGLSFLIVSNFVLCFAKHNQIAVSSRNWYLYTNIFQYICEPDIYIYHIKAYKYTWVYGYIQFTLYLINKCLESISHNLCYECTKYCMFQINKRILVVFRDTSTCGVLMEEWSTSQTLTMVNTTRHVISSAACQTRLKQLLLRCIWMYALCTHKPNG